MTRNVQDLGGSVSRITMISPLQNEMLRRNRSKIFITVAGESMIDSVLFQGYRPMEGFIPAAARAIALAGLKDISGDLQLQPAYDHNPSAGFGLQHLVSKGWLEDKDSNVVDLIIELQLVNDQLPNINMKTFDAPGQVDSNENPLCIFCGIEDLYPQSYDDDQQTDGNQTEVAQQPETQASGNDNQSSSSNGNGSGRGRVVDPENDGRLKRNRENAMARAADQGSAAGATAATASQGSTARMAGKPGRVARPWDGRLKVNRGGHSADAGGR